MKCQRDGCSSFHLWAYCLWHPLYYLIILCLGQLTQRTKRPLLPYFHHFRRSHLHDLLFNAVAQLETCTYFPLTILHEMHLRCLPLTFFSKHLEQGLTNYGPIGQIQPTACFCKAIGTQPHPCVYILSMTAFMIQQQRWVVARNQISSPNWDIYCGPSGNIYHSLL